MIKFLLLIFISISFTLSAQIPAGYYDDAVGKSGAALKTSLHNRIKNHTDKGYAFLYTIYRTSDNTSTGNVWDMYSTCTWSHAVKQCGNYSTVCDCYNREHSIPQSWFNSRSPMQSDAFHVYPTDGKVNGQRSNFPFGECAGGSSLARGLGKLGSSTFPGYTGTVFEPVDEYKGDFARTYFYFATRYQDIFTNQSIWAGGESFARNTYPSLSNWSMNLFLKWHIQDPVSQKEIVRNNAIYVYQENRNPFIDYPTLVDHIWGNNVAQPWSATQTQTPALSAPTNNSTIELGKVVFGQSAQTSVFVKGSYLSGSLNVAMTGLHASLFSISTNSITKFDAEAGILITIAYNASQVGVHTAQLQITGGGIALTKVNFTAESTDSFMALAATDITETSFTANWTASSNASNYLLDVYSISQTGTGFSQMLLEEEFNSGLPVNWIAEGYTDNQTAGNMRLASSNANGKITTAALNLSNPTLLTVRARQFNGDAGSLLTATVDGELLASWTTGVENKTFTHEIQAKTSNSKISLAASTGKRVFVDYVSVATKGAVLSPVSVLGYPQNVGNVLNYQVSGLESDSSYYYTVTPSGGSKSEVIELRTKINTTLRGDIEKHGVQWKPVSKGVQLSNLPLNSPIFVFDIAGRVVFTTNSNSTSCFIPLRQQGVYILRIQDVNLQIKFVR